MEICPVQCAALHIPNIQDGGSANQAWLPADLMTVYPGAARFGLAHMALQVMVV